uniref:ATP-binding protein n=2 Tax=cellular organisms TaxID=131567 RepID=UPI0037DC46AA
GLENLKEYLQNNKAVFNNPGIAASHGIDMPAGVMIVGMPGCGKSLTAKCISKEFGVPLLRLDIGRLMGKYVGESEENLRKAIRVAEATTPCILWIDEIEKAFAGLGSGGEVTTRLFGQFLTWMQEKKSAIYVVATANDISNLPPEFLRRGRFDEIFQVRFPNIKEREAIFKIQLEKRNGKRLPDGVDPHALAAMLKDQDNYSGADIESIVKEAMKRAFVDGQRKVTQQDLQEIIRNTKSSYQSQKEKLDKMLEKLNSLGVKPASR